MGVQVNKEMVSGVRTMLKYSVIRYSVAAAIVIAALFGGLYLIKDSEIVNAFKRDDNQFGKIENALKTVLSNQDTLSTHLLSISAKLDNVEKRLNKVEELSIVSTIFNPNVPTAYRAQAFKQAKALKMNHGIKQQYIKFIQQYPDAAWETEEDKSADNHDRGHWVEQKNGVKVFEFDK